MPEAGKAMADSLRVPREYPCVEQWIAKLAGKRVRRCGYQRTQHDRGSNDQSSRYCQGIAQIVTPAEQRSFHYRLLLKLVFAYSRNWSLPEGARVLPYDD